MTTISYQEAMLRARYTKHGLGLLEVVQRQPGIELEALVRDHDPAPPELFGAFQKNVEDLATRITGSPLATALAPKKALRRFPSGGYAVKQLCEAGALVITEDLRVYRPQDLPSGNLSERPDEKTQEASGESKGATPKVATERRRASA